MSSETTPSTAVDVTGQSLAEVLDGLRAPVVALAFWAAIALPFLHVPLLLLTGLNQPAEATAFGTLLVANLFAIYVGHSHRRR